MIDGATILIADDSPDDVELLKRAFQKAGLPNPVRILSDGSQVMEYLRQTGNAAAGGHSCPLLLLLDLQMPGCGGFAVLDWLRQQPHLRGLPTIVFTDSDQPSDMDRSFRLGAHGYWVKPSRFEDLVRLAARLKATLGRVSDRVENEFPLCAAA